MKKLVTSIALSAAVSASLALTGCSAGSTAASGASTANAGSSASKTSASPTRTVTPAPDLTGSWKQTNSHSSDAYQAADFAGTTITINWVSDGGSTKSIYWVGTFTAPTDAKAPYTWTSARDKAATDNALLASTDDTKVFTFQNGTISYSASALGTTTTITLRKS